MAKRLLFGRIKHITWFMFCLRSQIYVHNLFHEVFITFSCDKSTFDVSIISCGFDVPRVRLISQWKITSMFITGTEIKMCRATGRIKDRLLAGFVWFIMVNSINTSEWRWAMSICFITLQCTQINCTVLTDASYLNNIILWMYIKDNKNK